MNDPIPILPPLGTAALPLETLPPLALDLFIQQSGLSPATCWRYRRRGWLKTVVIAGRIYVPRAAIADFNARAERGEFVKTTTAENAE